MALSVDEVVQENSEKSCAPGGEPLLHSMQRTTAPIMRSSEARGLGYVATPKDTERKLKDTKGHYFDTEGQYFDTRGHYFDTRGHYFDTKDTILALKDIIFALKDTFLALKKN